ncbi:MAG TPA: DUF559 domain-containing protein, partial [Flavitalea sp.]|nr:DUF559 domain-containing protein [Flavitalea sp.]
MMQWSMRITAYAERLLNGLDTIDWPEPVKEMQRNWIGKSTGCELDFPVVGHDEKIRVFTTRIDTIYGVTFMVLAPEHELVEKITAREQRNKIKEYVDIAKNRSERERMSEVKRISGEFTGAFAINPFNNEKIQIWIADYVLASYGTGAVMAVPSSDTRDYAFAKNFNLPIVEILEGPTSDITKNNFEPKSGKMVNSDFLNGLPWNVAIEKALEKVDALGIGERKINYRMHDAIFGRQRYWGEPFPVYYNNGIPQLVREGDLPITLPEIDDYKPTETGEPPLARAKDWKYSLTTNPTPKERGFETSEKNYWHILKEFSKENRQNLTESEAILWQELRNNKLGYKIRRQHAIGIFIADFVCLDKRLVIEVDGDYHLNNQEYDTARTDFLNGEGFAVIRFTNEEVTKNLSKVLLEIKSALDNAHSIQSSSPSPPEKGKGDEAAYPFEHTTMPGWAGSSWYWFRYMASPEERKQNVFAPKSALQYWKEVDLYIGGSEHATGHLLYSRFWCKALRDLGYVESEEPFKKLINQGHIQGVSQKIFLEIGKSNIYWFNQEAISSNDTFSAFYSFERVQEINKTQPDWAEKNLTEIHVDIKFVENEKLNIKGFLEWRPEYADAIFFSNSGYYRLGEIVKSEANQEFIFLTKPEVEKMSKSKYNVVNPDDIIESYGADTLRMYEMFLGPLEQSKPWNTNGIDGVFKFLRKFWNLFHDEKGNFQLTDAEPTRGELKVLHKTLKKIELDVDSFSFNTSVSELMICVNELTSLKTNKRPILEPLVIALSSFAPHISEELWEKLGHTDTVFNTSFPQYKEEYLKESSFNYPISINGKVRANIELPLDLTQEQVSTEVLSAEAVQKWLE